MAESNGSLLLGLWRDSLHVTCGLTACTPGSAPDPTLGNQYGKTLPITGDVAIECRELRSVRYLSDGFCTSVRPVHDVVCTGTCLPIRQLPWYAEFIKVSHTLPVVFLQMNLGVKQVVSSSNFL